MVYLGRGYRTAVWLGGDMNTAIVLVIPKIRLVLCPNKDSFHGGKPGLHVSYLISVDCNGDWKMFDDPTEKFVIEYLKGNRRVPIDTLFKTCNLCHARGIR